MMTSTHALVGATVGAGTVAIDPALAPAAIVLGFVAGALPDADLCWIHRRTTHFPVFAPAIAVPIVALALASSHQVAILAAVVALSVAVHPVMDVLCGGVEVRPWEATSQRAVYNHATGRWLRPRRVVRYAGAPEDALVATAGAVPALAVAQGRLRSGLFVVLVVSVGFALVRRRLAPLSERLFADGTEQG